MPSLATMPEAVAESIAARYENDWIMDRRRTAEERLHARLRQGGSVTEILCLPAADRAAAGPLELPLCDMFGQPQLYCTGPELLEHLRSLRELLRKEERYRVLFSRKIPSNILIMAMEGRGVMVARAEPPGAVFQIREPRMTAAFLEYLQRMIGGGTDAARPEHIELDAYISALERESA